jgi:hypothetical protein
MNHSGFPLADYHARLEALAVALIRQQRTKNYLAWARLFALLLLLPAFFYLFQPHPVLLAFAATTLLAVFIYFVTLSTRTAMTLAGTRRLVRINETELAVHAGRYTELPSGHAFMNPGHDYSSDLDIFGPGSLYQYINRTQSEPGSACLANWLQHPAEPALLPGRQAAISELAQQVFFRQQLQSAAMEQPLRSASIHNIDAWLKEATRFSNHQTWKLLRFIYPLISMAVLACFITHIFPYTWFGPAYIAALVISGLISRQIGQAYMQLTKIVPELQALRQTAGSIEKATFGHPMLQSLRGRFTVSGETASASIRQLRNILDKFDATLNLVLALVLNPLLLWNLQLVFRLEQWRLRHQPLFSGWIAALAELEALTSLANLHYNHPAWVFPVFDNESRGTWICSAMGHPLIPEVKRVDNTFTTTGRPRIALITGSNMAGKSTFLRSVGVNTVLAMAGAPVCADAFRLSPVRVVSSMRIADNLQESTSTFYAELKKLKTIIELLNRHENVLVILDEILRGTNSADRHTGSAALVKQLIAKGAVALLATHDVELAGLEAMYPSQIHNYHFDAAISGEELYFDYKLQPGVCRSINASLLMKKIGIEI